MFAALKLLPDLLVATAAINRVGDGFAGTQARGIHLGVALAAGYFGMPRASDLDHSHEHIAAVRGSEMLIGVAAHAIGIGHALGIENVAHFMGLMAVDAGRQDVRFLFPKFSSDGLAMHLFDLGVTLRACGRDVAAGNRGARIRMWEDVVRRVAGDTVCSYHQSFLEQRLAVNAFGIVFEDVVLVNLPVRLDRRSFAVTFSAHEGHS